MAQLLKKNSRLLYLVGGSAPVVEVKLHVRQVGFGLLTQETVDSVPED